MKELMAKKKKRKKISLIFFISLLTHMLVLLMIISFAFKKFNQKSNKTLLTKKRKKNDVPASLKPRKSNFGTTVFFDDTPQFTPPKSEKMGLKTKKETEKVLETEEKEKIESSIKKDDVKIPIEKKSFLAKKETKSEMHKSKEEKKEQEKSTEQKKSQEISTEIIRNVGLSKKDKTPEIPKKKSILSMTKGFLQNLKDEGKHWSKRIGDDKKEPTLQDLKEDCYNQKIHWCFQNETRILISKMPLKEKINLLKGFKVNPVIFFLLDQKGNLIKLKLIRSSGAEKYDKYVLKAFEQASPYPPIPKHLKMQNYGGNRVITNPR